MRHLLWLLPLVLFAARAPCQEDEGSRFGPEGRRARQIPDQLSQSEAARGRDLALDFLVRSQNPDGSFASGAIEGVIDINYSVAAFYDWQLASHALVLLALLESPQSDDRAAALEKALDWFLETRRPRRGSDWDNDTIWAALYGTVVAVRLHDDSRFVDDPRRERLKARALEFLEILILNQVPTGGWGYYDDPPYSRRPKWGTSFSTALVLPTLERAEQLGWLDDPRVRQRAVAYVRRCRLPNGAYEYDLNPIPRAPAGEHINKVKGSLGRIQVCNWALFRSGDERVTLETIRTGLGLFFEHHRFLDIARMRPVPHEAYYRNAGYFYYFGHYYAALAINELPEGEREAWHARLRPEILKTQRSNGSMCDFLGQRYMVVADTALGVLTLQAGLGGG
ncbi:MAG: prenyltransferase/squalene oxidase repeat-containing protein [Planctomycetota bacterium]